MQKKIIPILASTALLALTGCFLGGKTNTNTGSSEGGEEKVGHFDHKVTIKFVQSYAQGYQPRLQEFVDTFKAIEPNIEINLEDGWVSGNYDTIHNQTISDIGTGEYGDLVVCYPDHVADYIDYGKAVKLDDYMTNADYGWTEKERKDVVPSFLAEGQTLQIEGTYCLPFSKSTEAMFYNETRLFDTELVTFLSGQGITMNKQYIESLTWDELFDNLCPALEAYDAAHPDAPLTVKKEGSMNSYVGYDSDANLFITLAEQYGYGYTSLDDIRMPSLDFNNDNMKALMKRFAAASTKGYLRSPAVIGKSYSSNYFKERNVLFSIGSTAGVKNQVSGEFEVGVARVPQKDNDDPKLISQGPSVCILSHGDKDRILASWLFYKHLTNSTNTAKWPIEVGYLPVRSSAYSSEAYFDYSDVSNKPAMSEELLVARNAVYSSSTTNWVFTTPAFKGSSTARSEVGSLMATMLKDAMDGKTIDDAYLNTAFDLAENNTLKDMPAQ